MNRDKVVGEAKDIAGKVQQKVGEAIGSSSQQVKGVAKQVGRGGVFAERAERDVAELPRRVRAEELRTAVDGMHGLPGAGLAGIARSEREVRRAQRVGASFWGHRHPL